MTDLSRYDDWLAWLREQGGSDPDVEVVFVGGSAVTGSIRLANGSRWDSSWVQLLEVYEYRESIALMFADRVLRLSFPSPWLKQSPTIFESTSTSGDSRAARVSETYEEAFQRELVHFHACIADGEECRTPPEQARIDIDVLTRMFLASQ